MGRAKRVNHSILEAVFVMSVVLSDICLECLLLSCAYPFSFAASPYPTLLLTHYAVLSSEEGARKSRLGVGLYIAAEAPVKPQQSHAGAPSISALLVQQHWCSTEIILVVHRCCTSHVQHASF